jgi:colanic acid/amylovoran biosynthesis protein
MPKILITNTTISWNKGSAAQVISVVYSLRRLFPNIEFTLLSYCPELDSDYCSRYGITVLSFSGKTYQKNRTLLLLYSINLLRTLLLCAFLLFLRKIHLTTNYSMASNKHVKAYLESDLVLDLSGDSFSDWQNRSMLNVLALLPAILLKKPFVFFSQSIGPFNFWTLPFAKVCLNNSNLIVIREEVTERYLERIGIKNRHMCLAADCAFLLEPARLESVLEILNDCNISGKERPLVGISASVFMMDHFFKDHVADYLLVLSKLIDYLVENKKAYVVLIPHSVAPSNWGNDDIYATKSVYRFVKNKSRVHMIEKNYDPRELKGIIGYCDFFIGCRMHANIAAISQNIPTIAIGWSHKYYGIMKRVGMEPYVCNLKNWSFEELKIKADMLFSMREDIQKQLSTMVKNEQASALWAVKIVGDLLS